MIQLSFPVSSFCDVDMNLLTRRLPPAVFNPTLNRLITFPSTRGLFVLLSAAL
jgi:hypothetical protein